MKPELGFAQPLREELQRVPPELQARVHRKGALSDDELVSLTTRHDADPAMYHPVLPSAGDVQIWGDVTAVDEQVGDQAIRDGKVAFVVLAGGAGTRMGGLKLFAQIPHVATSVLAWKLMQAGNMPTWIMTSAGELDVVAQHMQKLVLPPGQTCCLFEQFEGYRLTPDNRLAWLAPGTPDLYPLGHGDVGPALVESGVLDDNPGIKYAYVCNVDNVLASPHAGLIGMHIRHGSPVTCEVVDRQPGDHGGVVAWIKDRLQVAEDFRLPQGFAVPGSFHNTNTMIVNIEVLRADIPWRWHRVRKQVASKLVIQHERLLQQYTEEFWTIFVRVPRDARYAPVKTSEDLEAAGKLLEGYRFK